MVERRFAAVRAYADRALLPVRKTAQAAGYDLAAAEHVTISPGEVVQVPTGVKAYMAPDEVLLISIRSSLATKRSLMLANGVGVIDADYVDNADNEGHILIPVYNVGRVAVELARGERVAQGIFVRFLTTADDAAQGVRAGGFGSTGI